MSWGSWNNARLVRENVAEEIARLKALSGKHMLLYAGSGIISTFERLHLIDEYRIRVHPAIVGTGLPLFQGVETQQKLSLIGTKTYSNGAVLLDYEPRA